MTIVDWEANGFEIIATAVNGKQALSKFKELHPQVVLTDIKMPYMDGIEFIGCLREIDTKTKVVLLTAYKDFSYAKSAIQHGISDYLIKSEISSTSVTDLLNRLRGMALTMIYEIVGKNISGQFSFVSINYDYAYLGAAPYIIIILVLSAAIFYFIYNQTRFSYHMRAVGSNENVAKNSGIRTQLVKWLSFVLGGIFVGISAILTISQSGSMGAQVNLGSVTLFFKPLMGILIALVMKLCQSITGSNWDSVEIYVAVRLTMLLFSGICFYGFLAVSQNESQPRLEYGRENNG